MNIFFQLSFRQKFTYVAHVFKALSKQHHKTLIVVLKQFIKPQSIVIDVGGHAGQFTKIFSLLAHRGHVYTFEPGKYAFSILNLVKRVKKLKNVSLLKVGASSTNTSATLSVPIKRSGSFGYGRSRVMESSKDGFAQEKISLVTIDSFVKEKNLKEVGFIKIDVEGHEMSVLKGAESTIERFLPSVMIEINKEHLLEFGNKPQDIFSFFKDKGYIYGFLKETEGTIVYNNDLTDGDYIFHKGKR